MVMRKPAYLSAAVLTLGVFSAAIGLAVRHHRRAQATAPAYTMIQRKTFFPKEGGSVLQSVSKRMQRSDGSWKDIATTYNNDGTVQEINQLFGISGRGVFALHPTEQKLIFESPKRHAFHVMNEEAIRKDPTFIGEQTILGFKCLGQRFPDGTEVYLSTDLSFPLKEVITSDKGRQVIEAIKIDFGEPSENEFGTFPNYPVDYSFYEQRIARIEKEGNSALAKQMREDLAAAKEGASPRR